MPSHGSLMTGNLFINYPFAFLQFCLLRSISLLQLRNMEG